MTHLAIPEARTEAQLLRAIASGEDFCLEDWLVEPALNQITLRSSGENRHLEPRLMKLLCHLAAHQGSVVPRDELVSVLWPRVVVNENSLTRAVSELRKQLNTVNRPARDYLRTIPKRGYRLTADVSAADQARARPAPATLPDEAANRSLWQRPASWLSGATALSLGLVLSLGSSTLNEPQLPARFVAGLQDEVIMDQALPTGAELNLSASWVDKLQTGSIQSPVLAADGERFAYIKQELSGSTIYLGKLSSSKDPMAVFSDPGQLDNLTWSPLGNALLFTREDAMQPAAVFNSDSGNRTLYSLDLQTLQVDRLIRESTLPSSPETPKTNLTYWAPSSIPIEPA